jgi:uncharacterized protein involved in outer membrane biogenesis
MARRWIRALVIILMLVIGAGAAAVVVTQTAWFCDWLRGYIVNQANQNMNGRLSIGRLGGNIGLKSGDPAAKAGCKSVCSRQSVRFPTRDI